MKDIEIVREAIELFAVHYFDSIEMSGSVKFQDKDGINYISIDLTRLAWDEKLDKLHQALTKYLKDWAQRNHSNFSDYISISRLTIEYLLPEKAGSNQNQSKHVKLFRLPSYFYRSSPQDDGKTYPKIVRGFLKFWFNTQLRNTVITLFPTLALIAFGIYKIETDNFFHGRLLKAYDYINIASGIMASFVLGFLITKALTIRQDKLKYTGEIRDLSNKLTYFRNICFNLSREHNFWSSDKPFYKSYEYANSIKHDITFEEYHYPNYDDDVKYAKFKSFYREDLSHNVVSLILQLHAMAGDSFLDSGLSYTRFPADYIYLLDEMDSFIVFNESNQIWYCCSEIKIFPENFHNSYYIKEIVEDINRIYPQNNIENLSRDKLEEVSLDFQYRIIPKLFKLTKIVNSDLPLSIRYFVRTFTLLMIFGLIVPTLTYLFIDKTYALLSVFAVIGIIGHILLSVKPIIEAENLLDKKNDYL